MNAVPAGDNAQLIELGAVTAAELHAAARAARAQPGVIAVVPGHSSLYVIRGDGSAARDVPQRDPRTFRLRVEFDGEDLPDLLARVRPAEFFARVARLRLTARYLGFRGGFAYLDGWPEEWAMPRRPTSRPHVNRGTFAVAGNVAAFYPIDSPGGWNLLGHTDTDLEHALIPGDDIVIEVARSVGRAESHRQVARLESTFFEAIAAPLTIRVPARNWTNLERGFPEGGAFDDAAAALARGAIAGEAELFECAMIGPRLRFRRDAVVAWCTPDLATRVERVRAGEERSFGRITGGLRAYLAVGEAVGVESQTIRGDRQVIRAVRGPHDTSLTEIECEVTPRLDRVGIRLKPLTPIAFDVPASLPSCGMQCGTVQLHPDGTLVAMGPDHPVTGGYLQPMTVLTSERWKLGQLVPGERVLLTTR